MKFHTLSVKVLLSTLIIGIVACGGGNDKDKMKAKLETVRKEIAKLQEEEKKLVLALGENTVVKEKMVEVQTVNPQSFFSDLKVEGTVDADESTIATSKMPGTVMVVYTEVGRVVKKGQILATLDNSSALKGKMELEQQVAFATTVFEKQKRLWEKGIGTEIQYLSSKNQKEALEKSLNTLNANLENFYIKAPISGTVEAADVKVGQIAAPGMPAFKVVNLANVKIMASISESYSKKVSAGDEVSVELPDLNKTVKGKISFASNYIDPLNRTFKIEVKLAGVADIKPNMVAKLSIVDYVNNKALVVPSNSIQRTESETFVMVMIPEGKGFVAKKRNITIGKTNLDQAEIVDGLKANDVVIVNGFQELTDGQAVKPTNLQQ